MRLSFTPLFSPLQALSKRTQELEQLKADWSSHTTAMTSEHSVSLNAERERALQSQAQAQARYQQEKREVEQAHVDKVCVCGGVCGGGGV